MNLFGQEVRDVLRGVEGRGRRMGNGDQSPNSTSPSVSVPLWNPLCSYKLSPLHIPGLSSAVPLPGSISSSPVLLSFQLTN